MASEEERRCSEEAGVERTEDAPKVEPPPVYFAPMTSSKPRYFYDPQAFPQLAALREHLDEIAEEALTLHRASVVVAAEVVGNFDSWSGDASFNSIAQQVSQAGGWVKWWNNDSPTDPNKTLGFDWTIFGFIYEPGGYIEANGMLCPKTMAVLKCLKNVRVAGFSRLNAGTEIKPHSGFTGRPYGALAFHMGLVIPADESCGFQCFNEVHVWRNPGDMIVFDDTFTHAAWNRHSDAVRIVLYIDFALDPQEWLLFP